jgi:hypothetical protein
MEPTTPSSPLPEPTVPTPASPVAPTVSPPDATPESTPLTSFATIPEPETNVHSEPSAPTLAATPGQVIGQSNDAPSIAPEPSATPESPIAPVIDEPLAAEPFTLTLPVSDPTPEPAPLNVDAPPVVDLPPVPVDMPTVGSDIPTDTPVEPTAVVPDPEPAPVASFASSPTPQASEPHTPTFPESVKSRLPRNAIIVGIVLLVVVILLVFFAYIKTKSAADGTVNTANTPVSTPQ